MKKIFVYHEVLMNGTVTASDGVAAFGSKELAEEVRKDVIEANRNNKEDSFLTFHCTDVEEVTVYESKDEVPFYKKQ